MARKRPGIYAALSAYYFDDVAIMEAGEAAELLYVRLLAYASRQPQMEGFIPRLVVMSRLGIDPDQGGDAISRAERLADCGLLERCEGGYVIRSWGRWNKTAAELGIESAKDRVCKPRRTHATPAPVAPVVSASMPTPTPVTAPAPVPVAPVSVPVSVSVVGTYKTHKTPAMTQATPQALPEAALEVMPEAMPERDVVAEPMPEAGSWPEADALIQEWEQQAQTEALAAENDTEPEAVAETVAPTPATAPAPVVSAPSPVSVSGSAPPPPDIETASDGALLKVRKRRRPARPLPEDWEPHDKHKQWAEQHRLDLAHEVFQFTNHAKANDRRQADWDAAFYTWLGKAYPRHTSNATMSAPPPTPARASASASVSDRIRGWQEAGQQLIHQATHQPTPELMMIGDSA